MKAYHIWIDDQIYPESFGEQSISARFVRGEIAKAKSEGAEKLVLHINSPGGHVFEGFSIYNELTRAGLPIESYIEGMSASIATLIMLAGADNTIFMSPASQLMFHKPMIQTQGNSDDHAASIEELQKIEQLMAERYAAKAGKDISFGHELMSKGDYWVNPKEAKEMNIIDVIQLPVAAYGKKTNFLNNNQMKKNNLNPKVAGLLNAMASALGLGDDSAPIAGAYPLADGKTILYCEGDLETGKAVFIDEAMTTPASEGEHGLQDGRIVIVDAAGVAVEIREVEAPADASAELEAANARIADLEAQLAAAQTAQANLETAHTAKMKDFEAKFKTLKAAITSADTGVVGDLDANVKPVKQSAFIEKTKARVALAQEGKLKQ